MPMGQTAFPVGGGALGRDVNIIAAMLPAPQWKMGGFIIDWNYVIPALVAFTIAGSGKFISVGDAVIRYGTCMCRITATTNGSVIGRYVPYSANQANTTVTSGGTVLGVFTMTLPTALSINPGDVLTVDTAGQQEQLTVQSYVTGSGLTTFTTATTKTHANGVAVVKTDDGRGTLRRGECFLMVYSAYLKGDIFYDQGHGVINGGNVYLARVASDVSGGVLTNPTRAQLETGFPNLVWTLD